MGKGSGRRQEDPTRVSENHENVKWGVRDKSKDTFKVTGSKPNKERGREKS